MIVNLIQGNIIEENHYYSFGLKIAAISSKKYADSYDGDIKNRYQMQGAFSEMDDDIGWNDFALRNYDPQIGRWMQMDPYADDYIGSPYIGMGNDPVNIIDPSGGDQLPIRILMNFATVASVAGQATNATSTLFNVASKAVSTLQKAMSVASIIIKVAEVVNIISKAVSTEGIGNAIQGINNDGHGPNRNGVGGPEIDYNAIGVRLGVEGAVVKAVALVESSGAGFNGPFVVVRFEGHWFEHFLKQKCFDIKYIKTKYPSLVYDYSKKNNTDKPHGYKAYALAASIDLNSAMMSTSYGAFQIMGFNYRQAGFSSVTDFVLAQNIYQGQVESFMNFVANNPTLLRALKAKDFTTFARNYNGLSYKDNDYAGKMQRIYDANKPK